MTRVVNKRVWRFGRFLVTISGVEGTVASSPALTVLTHLFRSVIDCRSVCYIDMCVLLTARNYTAHKQHPTLPFG